MGHMGGPAIIPEGEVFVERAVEGKPHAGKVLAVVQAHADDLPLWAGGTVAKLIKEGYVAYIIQTTNDEKCGPTTSIGKTILSNEEEVDELARILGCKQVFNLGYRNHRLDEVSIVEIRARLIFLFRALKVDTIISFNPWGHWEENPDHYVTGQAVEAACWTGGMNKDYPEHFAAGLEPHTVWEKYLWIARGGQLYNRVVEITDVLEEKVASLAVNKSQGPGGSKGSQLKAQLAAQGLRLPELGDDDETADREYCRLFLLDDEKEIGEQYGLAYAEPFYYIGRPGPSKVEAYVEQHAVSNT